MNKAKELDQFYTSEEVVNFCLEKIDLTGYDFIIEPSAGAGAFFNKLPTDNRIGLDIDPKCPGLIKQDFLTYEPPKGKILTIGNPPFGRRSKLSVEFFKKAAKFSHTIAFIIPLQWRKWSVQSKIPQEWKLLNDYNLPSNKFRLGDKLVKIHCCLQIWSKEGDNDLRMKVRPPIEHSDFIMYQYNRTEGSLKYFNYDWDFAVVCQGYHSNYNNHYNNKVETTVKHPYIFFKARDEHILKRLKSMDFEAIAKGNTTTPGFTKSDFVREYIKLYPEF